MWESLLFERAQDWQMFGYILLFVGMVVEGEVALFAGVFLTQAGNLGLFPVVLVSFAGMFIGDILWYWFGHYLDSLLIAKRFANGLMPILDRQLKERPVLSLIVAKFVYFLHRVALVRARPCGISFKRFIAIDLVAVMLWLSVGTTVAVLFAASFSLLKDVFKYTEVGLLCVVLVLMLGEHLISVYYKKRLIKKEAVVTSHEM